MRKVSVRTVAIFAAVFALGACDEAADVTGVPEFAPSFVTLPANPVEGVVHVCKDYAGTGNFDFNITLDAHNNGTMHVSNPFTLAAGSCVLVASTPPFNSNFVQVTVTELVPATADLTKIEVYTFNAANPGAGWNGAAVQTYTSVDGIQVRAGNDLGRVIVFYNEEIEIEEQGEGCTPGYWKNHLGSWVGYTSGQLNSTVFSLGSFPVIGGQTLLQALNYGGGSGLDGATRILLRAAVAALLNASNPDVDYSFTTADIIADVNAALASGDRNTILNLASTLDTENNLGCPLN